MKTEEKIQIKKRINELKSLIEWLNGEEYVRRKIEISKQIKLLEWVLNDDDN
jgi:hypothetical protein